MEPLSKDENIRLTALDRAIQSGSGLFYNDNSFTETSADKIIEAAKKFETYLKGDNNGN